MGRDAERAMWFLAGLAVGAAIALLVAPQSGRELRRSIARKAEDTVEAISEASRELVDRGREAFEKGRRAVAEEAEELLSRGRRIFESKG